MSKKQSQFSKLLLTAIGRAASVAIQKLNKKMQINLQTITVYSSSLKVAFFAQRKFIGSTDFEK